MKLLTEKQLNDLLEKAFDVGALTALKLAAMGIGSEEKQTTLTAARITTVEELTKQV